MDAMARSTSVLDPKCTCLYLINLPRSVEENALFGILCNYGEIQSCRIVRNGDEPNNLGIVNMATNTQAQDAVMALEGDHVDAGALDIIAGPPIASRQSPCDNVYVRNMPAHWTEQDLRDMFGPYGAVQECRILHRGDDVRGAGALVRMPSMAAATQSILALNGHVPMSHLKDFTSMPLLVRYADSPEEKARKQARKEQIATTQQRWSLDIATQQEQQAFPGFRNQSKSLDLTSQRAEGVPADSFLNSTTTTSFPSFAESKGVTDVSNLQIPSLLDIQSGRGLESLLSGVPTSTIASALGSNALALNALSVNTFPQNGPLAATPSAATCTSLYVKNLPPEADRLWLYERFAPHGSILSVKVLQEERSSRCRGVGFVNFAEAQGALNAIQNVNGMKVADKHLHVSLQINRGRF